MKRPRLLKAHALALISALLLCGTCSGAFCFRSHWRDRNPTHALRKIQELGGRSQRPVSADTDKVSKKTSNCAVPLLRSSASDAADSSSHDNTQKFQLTRLYRVGKYMFASIGLFILLMPDRTMTQLLASKVGGAAGFGLAAGLCYILAGANENDRLSSDTYKRLNLGLFGFSSIGLFAFPGEAAFHTSLATALILSLFSTIARIYGTVVSYMGWKRGFAASDISLIQELAASSRDVLKGLRVQDKKKALTYRNICLLVALGAMSSFLEGMFMIRYLATFKHSLFEVSLQWSAVGRLFMISTMIYSLKDAAERDRLTGTTFIQLNIMVGIWSALVGLGQSIRPISFEGHRGVELYAIAIPFFVKAFKSLKEKEEKKRSRS